MCSLGRFWNENNIKRTLAENHGQKRRTMEEESIQKMWLTYPEAQAYVGIGRTKLWETIGKGEIKVARVGRAVRISRESLDEFMQRQAQR